MSKSNFCVLGAVQDLRMSDFPFSAIFANRSLSILFIWSLHARLLSLARLMILYPGSRRYCACLHYEFYQAECCQWCTLFPLFLDCHVINNRIWAIAKDIYEKLTCHHSKASLKIINVSLKFTQKRSLRIEFTGYLRLRNPAKFHTRVNPLPLILLTSFCMICCPCPDARAMYGSIRGTQFHRGI